MPVILDTVRRVALRAAAVAVVAPPTTERAVASISADGTFVTLAADPPAGQFLNEPIIIRRQRVDPVTGLPVNWDEEVWLTSRRYVPGTYTPTARDVMVERVIMAGNTLANQPAVNNPSTRTPPGAELRWNIPGGLVLANSHRPRCTIWSFYDRDGVDGAVRFTYRDEAGNTVVAIALEPIAAVSPWVRSPATAALPTGEPLVGHEWDPGPVDLTPLNNGRITLDAEVFTSHGAVISTATHPHAGLSWFAGTLDFRKHPAAASAPIYACVRAGAGGTPQASTNLTTARDNPFATFVAARTAAQALNNSLYGINGLDGIIFRFRDNAGADIVTGTISGASTCLIAGPIVEPEPTDTFPAGGPRFSGTFGTQAQGSTNPGGRTYWMFRGFNFRWVTGTNTICSAPSGIRPKVWVEGRPDGSSTLDFTGATAGVVPSSTAHCLLANYNITLQPGVASLVGQDAGGTWMLLDCRILNGQLTNVNPYHAFRVVASRVQWQLPTLSGVNATKLGDAVISEGELGPTATLFAFTSAAPNLPSGWRNSLLVNLGSAEANRGSFSSDASSVAGFNWGFKHCTIAGRLDRVNTLYVDGTDGTAAAQRVHQYSGYAGCILGVTPCKGEIFGQLNSPRPDREAGWREAGYGIGQRGNFHQRVWLSLPNAGNEMARSLGRGSVHPSSVGGRLDPQFVDDRTPTTYAGAAGATGGDYRALATVGAVPRGVRFDAAGAAVAPMCTRPGYRSGYAP